jgi:hypothetical protein
VKWLNSSLIQAGNPAPGLHILLPKILLPVLGQKVSYVISILLKSPNFQFSVIFPSDQGLKLPPVLWIRISFNADPDPGSQAIADLLIDHKT